MYKYSVNTFYINLKHFRVSYYVGETVSTYFFYYQFYFQDIIFSPYFVAHKLQKKPARFVLAFYLMLICSVFIYVGFFSFLHYVNRSHPRRNACYYPLRWVLSISTVPLKNSVKSRVSRGVFANIYLDILKIRFSQPFFYLI